MSYARYRIGLCRTPEHLAKGPLALGKGIAERPLGKVLIGKDSLCRVPRGRRSAKALPSAMSALGKG